MNNEKLQDFKNKIKDIDISEEHLSILKTRLLEAIDDIDVDDWGYNCMDVDDFSKSEILILKHMILSYKLPKVDYNNEITNYLSFYDELPDEIK